MSKPDSADAIRYANCWEDADRLLEGLALQPGQRILSIASGGDNSFSLLTTDPQLVVAVDHNPVQLHVLELKRAAIKALPLAEVKEFLGFLPSRSRQGLYARLADQLPAETRVFWDAHMTAIRNGLALQGKFERYFLLFSGKVLPMVHNKQRVAELFQPKSAEAQQQFFDQVWNSKRWRMLFRVFFNKFMMQRLGRDASILQETDLRITDFVFDKAATHLSSPLAQDNHFLQFIITGEFLSLPHYLRKDNFEKIRANIDRLVTVHGPVEKALEQHESFDAFNLSNIFEYMDQEAFSAAAEQLANAAEPGARFAYWNLLLPRRLSEVRPTAFQYHTRLSQELTARDRGFFYHRMLIEEKG